MLVSSGGLVAGLPAAADAVIATRHIDMCTCHGSSLGHDTGRDLERAQSPARATPRIPNTLTTYLKRNTLRSDLLPVAGAGNSPPSPRCVEQAARATARAGEAGAAEDREARPGGGAVGAPASRVPWARSWRAVEARQRHSLRRSQPPTSRSPRLCSLGGRSCGSGQGATAGLCRGRQSTGARAARHVHPLADRALAVRVMSFFMSAGSRGHSRIRCAHAPSRLSRPPQTTFHSNKEALALRQNTPNGERVTEQQTRETAAALGPR